MHSDSSRSKSVAVPPSLAPKPKKRIIWMKIDGDPLLESFADFAATAYPDRPLNDAAREAITAFMGTEPLDAARQIARRAAFLLVKKQAADLYRMAFAQVTERFAMIAAEDEAEIEQLTAVGAIPR